MGLASAAAPIAHQSRSTRSLGLSRRAAAATTRDRDARAKGAEFAEQARATVRWFGVGLARDPPMARLRFRQSAAPRRRTNRSRRGATRDCDPSGPKVRQGRVAPDPDARWPPRKKDGA